jgi:hypothetical protein
MKIYIHTAVCVLFCALLALPAMAQKRDRYKSQINLSRFDDKMYHFGFMLGYNVADYYLERRPEYNFESGVYSITTDNQPGFNLGIVASMNLTKNISFRFLPTLTFEDRLLIYRFSEGPDSTRRFDKRVESTFIDFPINMKLRTDRVRNFAAYAVAGGRFRIDMQSQRDVKNILLEEQIVKTERNDWCLEVGGGFDFFLKYFKFGIELKMLMGMPNVLVDDDTPFSDPIQSLRSRTFMVSLTFEG